MKTLLTFLLGSTSALGIALAGGVYVLSGHEADEMTSEALNVEVVATPEDVVTATSPPVPIVAESPDNIQIAQEDFSGEMTLEDALSIIKGEETPDGDENKIGLPESAARNADSPSDNIPTKTFDNQFEDEIIGMALVLDEPLLPVRAQVEWMEKDAPRIVAGKDKKRATLIIAESTGHRFTKSAVSALPEGVVLAIWPDSQLLSDDFARPYVLMFPPTDRMVEKTYKPLIQDTEKYEDAEAKALGFLDIRGGKLDQYETLLTPIFTAMARNGKTLYLESTFPTDELEQRAAKFGADYGRVSMRLDMGAQAASWTKFIAAIPPSDGGIALAIPSPSQLDSLATLLQNEKGDVVYTAVLPENQKIVIAEY